MKKIKTMLMIMLTCLIIAGFGISTFAAVANKTIIDNNEDGWFDNIITFKESIVGTNDTFSVDVNVGEQIFVAKFIDNDISRELIKRMPFTVNMTDFNGQEKVTELSGWPSINNTESPTTIHSGDIYVWSEDHLVLFYHTFTNSYGGYAKLGTIENTKEFETALGAEHVLVTFCLTK